VASSKCAPETSSALYQWLKDRLKALDLGKEAYRVPLDKANVIREGKDITIVSTSYMTIESLKAAEQLTGGGVDAEVIDLRSIKPIDDELIIAGIPNDNKFCQGHQ